MDNSVTLYPTALYRHWHYFAIVIQLFGLIFTLYLLHEFTFIFESEIFLLGILFCIVPAGTILFSFFRARQKQIHISKQSITDTQGFPLPNREIQLHDIGEYEITRDSVYSRLRFSSPLSPKSIKLRAVDGKKLGAIDVTGFADIDIQKIIDAIEMKESTNPA